MRDIVKYYGDTIEETCDFYWSVIKTEYGKGRIQKHWINHSSNWRNYKTHSKIQQKIEKFNYLKYKPANEKTLHLNKTVVQQGKSKFPT